MPAPEGVSQTVFTAMTRSRLLYKTNGVAPDEWDFCEVLAVSKVSELLGKAEQKEHADALTHTRRQVEPCSLSVLECFRNREPEKKKKKSRDIFDTLDSSVATKIPGTA